MVRYSYKRKNAAMNASTKSYNLDGKICARRMLLRQKVAATTAFAKTHNLDGKIFATNRRMLLNQVVTAMTASGTPFNFNRVKVFHIYKSIMLRHIFFTKNRMFILKLLNVYYINHN